jgi:EF hand
MRSALCMSVALRLFLMSVTAASAPSFSSGDGSHASPPNNAVPSAGADAWDANRDGICTCDDCSIWVNPNRDGLLDRAEFTKIRRAAAVFADANFDYFDQNRDGKVTRSEFVDMPSESILRFDKNGDCRVTKDETGASTKQKPRDGRGKKF